MQINDNRNNETVPFSEIEVGEEFMYSGRLHIRTDNNAYNAVDLYDGTLRTLDEYEDVGVVSAIITIQS